MTKLIINCANAKSSSYYISILASTVMEVE